MKKAVFIISIVLNFILIVMIVVGISFCRKTTLQMIIRYNIEEAQLQEVFLKELDSNDPKRIEAIKDVMRRNVNNGKGFEKEWAELLKCNYPFSYFLLNSDN